MDASDQLRAHAARYRKLAFLVSDGQARDALKGLADQYEARAAEEEAGGDAPASTDDRPGA